MVLIYRITKVSKKNDKKFFHEAVLSKFNNYVSKLIHDVKELIYNVDETYCSCNSKGRIVVPEGKNPFVILQQLVRSMQLVSH